ncbi:MAG: hypothetical protein A2Z04_01275, partial [Chloroflexi bacterium RBG_16_57_9]
DNIVGSVGRYRDFTREFLPRAGANRERWKWLDQAVNRLEDLPPIQVYQLGDAYFVKDGHHRISVALANEATHIEALVTEVRTRVPFTPDMDPSDFILQEEYANFLQHSHLDTLRPGQYIQLTIPGRYDDLIDHIAVHRYYLGIEQNREIPYEEAVTSWYDHVYLPAIEIIRREHVLQSFPGRTEADLYAWLMQHLYFLREEYGDTVSLEQAAAELVHEEGEKPRAKVIQTIADAAEAVKGMIDKITPHDPPGDNAGE